MVPSDVSRTQSSASLGVDFGQPASGARPGRPSSAPATFGSLNRPWPAARHGIEGHRHPGRPQGGLEQLALVVRHERVRIAVADEEGRRHP
ncbi:MAG: hypothetical protein MZU84_06370 [Sphingobacterium sp.]|nr:hypothetical protein [Sphingobacterium sp.]